MYLTYKPAWINPLSFDRYFIREKIYFSEGQNQNIWNIAWNKFSLFNNEEEEEEEEDNNNNNNNNNNNDNYLSNIKLYNKMYFTQNQSFKNRKKITLVHYKLTNDDNDDDDDKLSKYFLSEEFQENYNILIEKIKFLSHHHHFNGGSEYILLDEIFNINNVFYINLDTKIIAIIYKNIIYIIKYEENLYFYIDVTNYHITQNKTDITFYVIFMLTSFGINYEKKYKNTINNKNNNNDNNSINSTIYSKILTILNFPLSIPINIYKWIFANNNNNDYNNNVYTFSCKDVNNTDATIKNEICQVDLFLQFHHYNKDKSLIRKRINLQQNLNNIYTAYKNYKLVNPSIENFHKLCNHINFFTYLYTNHFLVFVFNVISINFKRNEFITLDIIENYNNNNNNKKKNITTPILHHCKFKTFNYQSHQLVSECDVYTKSTIIHHSQFAKLINQSYLIL